VHTTFPNPDCSGLLNSFQSSKRATVKCIGVFTVEHPSPPSQRLAKIEDVHLPRE